MFDELNLRPGTKLGPYTLGPPLGEGGMSTIYLATRADTEQPFALKVLSSIFACELGRQRFEREIRACAALRHPNTVRILDWGEAEDGTLYYAMEPLEGLDLSRLVEASGRQTPGRTVRILAQLAGALKEAHAQSLVHRDVKPSNVVLCARRGETRDVVKLLDFGLVLTLAPGGRLTLDGPVLGTPRYVSPEMITPGVDVGPSADIYGLGLVGYFLLLGDHAFDGADRIEILQKQRGATPPSLATLRPEASSALVSLLERCLVKDAERRPTAAELEATLATLPERGAWTDADADAFWASR